MKRTVYCEDAIAWLEAYPLDTDSSFVASLPDISEFPSFSLDEWKAWFSKTASLILSRCSDKGVAIFYQSDIKLAGKWIDKGYLCLKAAEAQQKELLFHKIICRAPAGTVTLGRPSYSHLLCFSKELRLEDPSRTMADVSNDPGEKTWQRGMGLKTAMGIAQFIAQHTSTRRIVNPFCGEGSVLAAANYVGLEAIGIERSTKRAEKSCQLNIQADGKSWGFTLSDARPLDSTAKN